MKKVCLLATLLCAAVLSTACSSTAEKVAAPAAPAVKPAADAVAVANHVKKALDAEPALKPFNLQVKGANDKKDPTKVDVTIVGVVEIGEQMAQAGMIAEQVKGVQYVFNNIEPKN